MLNWQGGCKGKNLGTADSESKQNQHLLLAPRVEHRVLINEAGSDLPDLGISGLWVQCGVLFCTVRLSVQETYLTVLAKWLFG